MKLPTAKNWGVTRASFPEQDWSRWEAQRFSRPPDGATIDTSYWSVWPCCIHCATWICAGCWDFRRSRATRRADQYCPKCGSREGFFSAVRHGTRNPHGPHVRKLPFLVPVISDERASIVRQLEEALGDRLKARAAADRVFSTACPAGDPCPATGCPACCPTYDPCGQPGCRNCHPQGEKMHVPEEADMSKSVTEGLSEDEARNRGYLPPRGGLEEATQACQFSCLTDGVNYPECPVHGQPEIPGCAWEPNTPIADAALAAGFPVSQDHETILPHAVKTVSDKIRCGHANGCADTDMISMTIAEAKELCNLAVQPQLVPKQYPFQDGDGMLVLGPEVFAGPDEQVLVWKGEHFHKAAKPTELREDPEARKQYMRRDSMEWSVRLHEKALANGQMVGTPSVISGAQQILDWLENGTVPDMNRKS